MGVTVSQAASLTALHGRLEDRATVVSPAWFGRSMTSPEKAIEGVSGVNPLSSFVERQLHGSIAAARAVMVMNNLLFMEQNQSPEIEVPQESPESEEVNHD